MKKTEAKKLVNAFITSGIIAIIVIVALTIGGELHSPIKDWLKDVFTHHWIGKGVLSFAGFFVLGYALSYTVEGKDNLLVQLLSSLFAVALLGSLAIIGFYYYEAFLVHH